MSLRNVAIAIDQLLNTLTGSQPDTVYAYSVKYNFHC